ncbi:MAG: U32 family peptidase [Candidatus Glassbacteria bacterium]
MKITAPISKPYEVPILAKNGAGEFYCGLVVDEWIKRYDISVWINRRSPLGANLRSFEELGEVTEKAGEFDCPVYLTLNSHYYTDEQASFVLDLAREASLLGVDSFIVGDPGFVRTLSNAGFEGRIIVSTIGSVLSSETARFYGELGARRIILPRQLSIAEVERITRLCPHLEFETFIYNDRCPFLESNCHTLHGLPNQDSFCHVDWIYDFIKDEAEAGESSESWAEHLKHYREWLWASSNCADSYTLTKVPNGTCGLCAIPRFLAAGVSSVKIVGREAPDYRKILCVQTVARVLDKALAGIDEADVKKAAIKLRNDEETCRRGYLCYYRDANPFVAGKARRRAVIEEKL